MKKVLILAYDFPPFVSVAGLRPFSWYKYLHEFDIYPVIVTRQWDNKYRNHLDYIAPGSSLETITEKSENGTILRTPYTPNRANRLMLKHGDIKYKNIRRLISAYFEFAQFLFPIGPKSRLYTEANNYLAHNKADAIVATGGPFVLFRYASLLGKKYNIPWIADYRDPWSQEKAYHKNFILKAWNQHFEKKTIKSAYSVSTVCDYSKLQIKTLVNNKTFHIIPNGFDPELTEAVKNTKQQNNKLTITFVGYIHKWNPLRSFIAVISDFISEYKEAKFKVNFYGINVADELREMIETDFPNLQQYINIIPKMSNDALLNEIAKDNILLLFNYYSILGTKIYDYVGIKRKILLCYSNDKEANELRKKYIPLEEFDSINQQVQEGLIKETNSGIVVRDSAHLRVVLDDLYSEFLIDGFIKCGSINTSQFSRKIQVQKLAEIINNIS